MRTFARLSRAIESDGNRALRVASDARAVRQSMFDYYLRTRDASVREQLVFEHLALVRQIAYRFAKRTHPLEDLVQVGTIGLINALDRFDPERGCEFSTYAVPTIVGEIKRYFRDKSWAMRVPRPLKDLSLTVGRAIDEMTVELGRPVTHREVAQRLGVDVDDILEAQEIGRAYALHSLDAHVAGAGGGAGKTVGEFSGTEDAEIAGLLDRSCLRTACIDLDRRERMIIYLKFFRNLSQREIGRRLGCTQMHVSRLQQRAIEKIRRAWTAS